MKDSYSIANQSDDQTTWHLRLLVLVIRMISFLPLPLLYSAGMALGEIAYWLSPSRRKITHTNLSSCFPEKSPNWIRTIARQHFHHMVISILTSAVAWWASGSRFRRLIHSTNRHYFESAIKSKQNVILLAPHFTTLEFLGCSLFEEFRVSSMYQPHKTPYIDWFMLSRRCRFGSTLFSYKGSMTPLIKSIRSGVPFYYLPDQDPGRKRGVFAPFYDIPTATFPALPKLARLGDAQVIPCMARLKRFGLGFEVIYGQPLKNFPSTDEIADVTAMNQAIEQLIEHAPAQYFWSHKRFKTRPEGEPSFY